MGNFIEEQAGRIAAVLPTFLVATGTLAVAALGFIRKHASSIGQWSPWSSMTFAVTVLFILLSLIGLGVAFGPMAPLFKSARSLDAGLGKPAPEVVFKDVSDDSVHALRQYRGRVVLLNLWATWCPPCRQELPVLDRLQVAYTSRGLAVITLTDQPRDELKDFLMKVAPDTLNGYVTSFGWLAIRNFRLFTLLIDRDGTLRDFFFGAQTYESFEHRIQGYLKRT